MKFFILVFRHCLYFVLMNFCQILVFRFSVHHVFLLFFTFVINLYKYFDSLNSPLYFIPV